MNPRKITLSVSLGILAYFIFLISLTPASGLAWVISQQSDAALSLSQTQGTIWNGAGRIIVNAKHGQPIDAGRINWHINPWGLLIGAINIHVQAESSHRKIETSVSIRYGKIQLADTKIELSAQGLKELFPVAALAAPSGVISITSARFGIKPNKLSGKVEMLWRNASTAFLNNQTLGDYKLVATADGSQLNLKLLTVKGVLDVNATGIWNLLASGELRLSGTAHARANANQLQPLLVLFGRDQGNGVRKINVNIRLPVNLDALPGFTR